MYAQKIRRTHGCVEHLSQQPLEAIVVERDSHLLKLARSLAFNPMRRGLVKRQKEWAWNSYRGAVGDVATFPFLRTDWRAQAFSEMMTVAVPGYHGIFLVEGIGGASPWEDHEVQIYLRSEKSVEHQQRRMDSKR